MFFTPELLSKRDSGFGLLWLAATLGSKSAFKKLPRRSVMTADIAQLCELISEPAEPLALRLSSNLMFGVVRVYKVKQEIFMTDVTNCVVSLKKVVQDMRASGTHDGQALMTNPVARPAAVTMVPDPRSASALEFDALVADWDVYLNLNNDNYGNAGVSDDDFDPKAGDKPRKRASKTAKKAAVEVVRKEVHTLQENHEHLLSASFDLSFANNSGPGQDLEPSSSHVDGGFDFFFPLSDGFDLSEGPGIGDDLARELGWNISPAKTACSKGAREAQNEGLAGPVLVTDDVVRIDIFQDAVPNDFNFDENNFRGEEMDQQLILPTATPRGTSPVAGKPTGNSNTPTVIRGIASPRLSLERVMEAMGLGSQEEDLSQPIPQQVGVGRKLKRTRLLLDTRIELTDDELKVARARYLESQKEIKRAMRLKQLERESGKMVEDLIWGAPKQITNPDLIAFWEDNLRAQIEFRTGLLRDEQRATKRRKVTLVVREDGTPGPLELVPDLANDMNMDWNIQPQGDADLLFGNGGEHRQSSEEPGRGRRGSRTSSVVDPNAFALNPGILDKENAASSQKSSLFPWDNALPSSSSFNAPHTQPNGSTIPDMVDIRIRSRSISRRGSPLIYSQRNSLNAIGISPIISQRETFLPDDEFMFNEHGPGTQLEETQLETQQDTQKSDVNLIAMEKNSFNFLEYAKMQCQTLPQPNGRLTFEKVTPQMTSTRHVAAAAFYHCLVLSTRDLLRLEQRGPYGDIFLEVVQ
ncbi:Rec8 like protein-domain-containing protein [Panaeolus papilionaceus]|nr:Rec8 like protein-domain-containing protein [Panaeolus papilionaceus]